MACAFALSGAAFAQTVEVSSATRLSGVMDLIRARDPLAAPGLEARFDAEPVPGIRAWIVRGVAGLDAPRGSVLARRALADKSPLVRIAAAEALTRTAGAAAVPDLAAALAGERNAGVRHAVAAWLGTIKTPGSADALEQALAADVDPNVRIQAARSLQAHGTGGARRAAKAAQNDADKRVRAVADEP